jgi:hypothetical protein
MTHFVNIDNSLEIGARLSPYYVDFGLQYDKVTHIFDTDFISNFWDC